MLTISALNVYPIKSAGGYSVERATLEARGLTADRRWLITDESGLALTQRDHARMASIRPRIQDGQLVLAGQHVAELAVESPATSRRSVEVWEQAISVCDGGDAAAEWLSTYLDTPARLAVMDDQSSRPVEEGGTSWSVSFADKLPLLVTSRSSLAHLNQQAGRTFSMDRFRPNIVLDGAEPFEEDLWMRLAIDAVELELVEPCGRCLVVNIDQQSCEADSEQEPLRTLSTYRRVTRGDYRDEPDHVYFGWRAGGTRLGELRVGDEVRVLQHRAPA